jgi:hypothetical protein
VGFDFAQPTHKLLFIQFLGFDGDEHRNKSLEKWRNALELAKKEKIELAITNPCFDF